MKQLFLLLVVVVLVVAQLASTQAIVPGYRPTQADQDMMKDVDKILEAARDCIHSFGMSAVGAVSDCFFCRGRYYSQKRCARCVERRGPKKPSLSAEDLPHVMIQGTSN